MEEKKFMQDYSNKSGSKAAAPEQEKLDLNRADDDMQR